MLNAGRHEALVAEVAELPDDVAPGSGEMLALKAVAAADAAVEYAAAEAQGTASALDLEALKLAAERAAQFHAEAMALFASQ